MENQNLYEGYRMPMYRGVTPLSVEHTKYIIEDEPFVRDRDTGNIVSGDLPEHIRNAFWSFLGKEVPLTKLTREEIKRLMINFDNTKAAYLMQMRRLAFTFEESFLLTQLRSKVFLKLNRALDGFERIQQTTQTQHMIYSAPATEEGRRGGVLRRIGGLFRGGSK